MKSFFRNLFRQKPAQPSAQTDAEPAAAKPSPQPAFEPYKKGDVIGGEYLVQGTLGMGGFGVVLLTTNRRTKEIFALRTFRDEFLADASTQEAFKKEALLWVNLEEHPFILAATGVVTFSERLFVVMDYIAPDAEGRVNLADHLRSGKPIRTERAMEWAIQFCMGMEHANAHGIRCHRDIKPANILIARNGALKIADFGLAAVAERPRELTALQRIAVEYGKEMGVKILLGLPKNAPGQNRTSITHGQDGAFGFSIMQAEGKMVCGTPGYMAPEVYRGETADVRSDIYAFGLVLWQLAAGSASPPFIGPYRGSAEEFMRATYEQQMSGRVPAVSEPLRVVVERCLNPNPSQRYSNFSELCGVLQSIFQRLNGHRVTPPTPDENTVGFWCNKGAALVELGQIDEGFACLDKALALDRRDTKTWCAKGVCFFILERHEEALGCFENALAIDPKGAVAWVNKGGVLKQLGRHVDALACYDSALAIDSGLLSAWNNKGKLLNFFAFHEEAISCFDKVLGIDPRDSAAWCNKGRTLGLLERHEEAIACFDKAIANEPGGAMAWNNKGASLDALGRLEEAIACYEKALEIDPRHVMAWFNKAGSENTIGRTADTIKSYSKFLEFAPPLYAEQVAYVRGILRDLQSR